MGARVEMISKRWITAAALGLLSACGSMANDSIGSNFAKAQLGKLTGAAPVAQPAPAAPDITNAAPGDILLVTIMNRGAVAPLTKVAQNGGTVTWTSPGQVTMTLQDDILIATRGLNDDLMGADVVGVRRVLAAGGGTARRIQSYMDSEDQITVYDMTCTITEIGTEAVATTTGSREAIAYTEACTGDALSVTNRYWLDGRGGNIVQSRQAAGPTAGFLQINPL